MFQGNLTTTHMVISQKNNPLITALNTEASTKKIKQQNWKLKTYTHYYLHAYFSPGFQVWAFCHQGPPDYWHLLWRVHFHLSWLSVHVWSSCGQACFQRKQKSCPLGWTKVWQETWNRCISWGFPAFFRQFWLHLRKNLSWYLWRNKFAHVSISRYNDRYILNKSYLCFYQYLEKEQMESNFNHETPLWVRVVQRPIPNRCSLSCAKTELPLKSCTALHCPLKLDSGTIVTRSFLFALFVLFHFFSFL